MPPAWLRTDQLRIGKWVGHRCTLFVFVLPTEQAWLVAREYRGAGAAFCPPFPGRATTPSRTPGESPGGRAQGSYADLLWCETSTPRLLQVAQLISVGEAATLAVTGSTDGEGFEGHRPPSGDGLLQQAKPEGEGRSRSPKHRGGRKIGGSRTESTPRHWISWSPSDTLLPAGPNREAGVVHVEVRLGWRLRTWLRRDRCPSPDW
jgi:hypothetical protein